MILKVDRTDCQNIMNIPDVEKNRLIEISWDTNNANQNYLVNINIYVKNRKGLIVDISKLLTENNIDIDNLETRKSKDETATIMVSFEINDKSELRTIVNKIKTIEGVLDVIRN